MEFQLLEANKKRLLRQDDWIGVAPSQPVNLEFLSSKEKSRIGRRRKVSNKHGATARRAGSTGCVTQEAHLTGRQYTGASIIGALQTVPTDIRVRIGTDALMTACSTQDQSRVSSDAMLFDQETHGGEPQATRGLSQTGASKHDVVDHTTGGNSATEREITWSNERPHRNLKPIRFPELDACPNSRGLLASDKDHLISSFARSTSGEAVSTRVGDARSVWITQHVEGVDHPLRLVFDTPASVPTTRSHNALTNGGNAVVAVHARASQTESMQQLGSASDPALRSEVTAAITIDDEEPWKSLLDIIERSTPASRSSGKNGLHHNPTARRHEAESTSWSQHATQGNDTISSSLISASLPSLKRDIQTRVHKHADGADLRSQIKTAAREVDEDEKRWLNLIFGGGKASSSSETQPEHRGTSVYSTWRGFSGYLPSSAAVSSIRSTPFRPSSGRALRMRDGVHDAAGFAPFSGSRAINSPPAMPAGFIEHLMDDEQGNETAERSAFGVRSVTHASLQNNASGDAQFISSGTLSNTETSRTGLDHPDHGESLIGHVNPGSSQPKRRMKRPSFWDTPAGDNSGIDVVDPDSLK